MKIGLLTGANLYFCPFVNIYTDIFDKEKIEYDIIAWNRINVGETGAIFYQQPFPYATGNRLKWLYYYVKYSFFLKKNVRKQKYDKLIIFGPQVGLFMTRFLHKYYYKKYCFDYRDIFIEQKAPRLFKYLLNNSSLNVISSNGFKVCLPRKFEYVLSHNFNINNVKDSLETNRFKNQLLFKRKYVTITTIGQIRDYDQNNEIMKAVCNKDKFLIKFIGNPGKAGALLEKNAKESNQKNVVFHGFYEKSEELELLEDADFINIYYPTYITHSTAISNRFYNALMLRKPMIVTKNSIQGDYVEKYNLGLAIESCENLEERILSFIESFDYNLFEQNCNLLLKEMVQDYDDFKKALMDFVHS